MSNKSVITPSDGIVISREWLNQNLQPDRARFIIKNSQPLKPVLEAVTDEVIETAACHTDCELDKEGTKANANNFLNSPIEIK